MKIFQFYIILLFGLIVDFLTTLFFFKIVSLKFTVAISIGFFCATLSNYILMRFWLFKSSKQKIANSIYTYFLATLSILLLRVVFSNLLLMFDFFIERYSLILILSVGLTSIINFTISKYVLFKPQVG